MGERRFDFKAAVCGGTDEICEEEYTPEILTEAQITTEDGKTIVIGGIIDQPEGNYNLAILRGGEWEIRDTKVSLGGAIGNDFVGLGAGVLAEGDAQVMLDGVEINCADVARTTVLARERAKVLVKNSELNAKDGDLPADYVGTVFPEKMKSTPWMLGINGNARGTNLMGAAVATYYNSAISAEKWGVLSTDDNTGVSLYVINCCALLSGGVKPMEEVYKNAAAGKYEFYEKEIGHGFPEGEWQSTEKPSGYIAYSIGGSMVTIAGSTLVTPDYAAICANGPASIKLTSSEPIAIADTYQYLNFVNELVPKKTVVFSDRYGIMYHSGDGDGVTTVDRGTVLYTGKAAFLVKGCGAVINVDDAEIYTGNGIILQVMDNDDAGINVETNETTTDYVEEHVEGTATETDSKADTCAGEGSIYATFSNMELNGDFYNASGWEKAKEADVLAGMGDYENEVGGGASAATDLSLVLSNVDYTGCISTTEAHHNQPVISHVDYDQISEVNNTVCIPENAGIIVKLTDHSVWSVCGTGYVTSLSIDETSEVKDAVMYVDGAETPIEQGKTYKGVIRLVGSAQAKTGTEKDPAEIASGCCNCEK